MKESDGTNLSEAEECLSEHFSTTTAATNSHECYVYITFLNIQQKDLQERLWLFKFLPSL